MSDPEKSVFISYRRDTSKYLARAIFEHLRSHGYDVFLDVETINSGEFDRIILSQIEARAHFLVLLNVGALERCVEPNDWVRREIEFAMEKQRNIVPILIDEFKFANAEQYLVGRLAELPKFNALRLYYDYFDEGMDRLRSRFLKQPLYGQIIKPTPAEQVAADRRVEQVTAEPAPTEAQLDVEEFAEKARLKLYLGDNEGAIAEATSAIQINPNFVDAYHRRGLAKVRMGDYDAAMSDFNKAIEIDPGNSRTYVNRGIALRDKNDLEGAIADYNEAIHLNPQYSEAYYNRAKARKAIGDVNGAIADYDEVIRLNPNDADAYYNRGSAYLSQGEFDSAIVDLNEAIRLNPGYANAYISRGSAHQAKDDLDGAIADYDQAIHLEPQNALVYGHRGNTYYLKGDLNRVITDYQKFLDLDGGKDYNLQAQVEEKIAEFKKQLGR